MRILRNETPHTRRQTAQELFTAENAESAESHQILCVLGALGGEGLLAMGGRPARIHAVSRENRAQGSFARRVLSTVRRIPPGKVATYGDVATAAGTPRAARAVGNVMRGCTARDVPCHRVIAAGGRLGGYGGRLEMKRALLRAEGILVSGDRIREFTARRWPRPAKFSRK